MCLYDFVSSLCKKKINTADLKYLARGAAPSDETVHRKGRPPNKRYRFQNQHPQASTHVLIEHSQSRVPVLYGPQIPRRDRDDTQERYSRALLTLFVPWGTVSDLCNSGQTWQNALQASQALISTHSKRVIENIQLLHECKKDRDEHLLQVIAEAQADNGSIDPMVLPANPAVHGEYDDMDNSDELLQLFGECFQKINREYIHRRNNRSCRECWEVHLYARVRLFVKDIIVIESSF
jgi:regulator of replication initiation timing